MTRRPEEFYIDYSHSFASQLIMAGLGHSPGSTLYYDSGAYGNYGNIYANLPKNAWKFDNELNRFCIEQTADSHHIALKDGFSSYNSTIYSISLWVCQVAAGTGTYYLFDSETGRFLLSLGGSGYPNYINFFDTTWRTFGSGVNRPAPNTWTALTIISNGANRYLYVNGIYKGANTSGSSKFLGGVTNIGGRFAGTTWYGLIGKYSDFLIHNRVLSLPEIQQFADKSNAMLSGMIKPAKKPTIIVFGSPSTPTHTSYFDTLEIVRDCYWLHPSGTNYITDGIFGGEHGLSTYSNGLYKSIQPSSFKYIQFHGPGTSGSLGIETSSYYCRLKSTNIDPDRFTIQMWASSDNLTGCTANFGINGVDIANLGPFTTLAYASGDFLLTPSQKQRIFNGRIDDNYDYCEIKFYTQDPIIDDMKFYYIDISCSGTSTWNNYETGLPGTDIKYFYPNKLGFRGGSIWHDQFGNIAESTSYSGIDIDPTEVGVDTEYITHTNIPVSGEIFGQLMPSGGLSLYFDIANGPSGTLDSLTQVTRAQMNLRMSLPPSGLYENARDTFEVNGYNYRFKEQDYKEDIPDAIGNVGLKQRSLGYYIYGAGDVIEQSGFKTYNVELNFIDPNLPSGNLPSIKYRNIDIFNNMEFQLVGLPSGVQLSSAQLLLECIPNDTLSLYIPGGVIRSFVSTYPDTSGVKDVLLGNGRWHHRGNIDEGEIFDAFYSFAEQSGTRTYPITNNILLNDAYGEYRTNNIDVVAPVRHNYYRNPIQIESFESPTYYRDAIANSGTIPSSQNINIVFDDRIILGSEFTLYFMLYRQPGVDTLGRFFTNGTIGGVFDVIGDITNSSVGFYIRSLTGLHYLSVPINSYSTEPILVWFTCDYNSTTDETICKLYVHSRINDYFDYPWNYNTLLFSGYRQVHDGSVTYLGSISYPQFKMSNVYLMEFGYSNSIIDLNFVTYSQYIKSDYDISPSLDKKFFASRFCNASYLSGSGIKWVVPNGSGYTEFSTNYYIDDWTSLNNQHSLYNPITTAGTNNLVHPSAIYIDLTTEHNTNHPSGVQVTIDIEFDRGNVNNWGVIRSEFIIPSGESTTTTQGFDYHIGMYGEPIVYSELENITANIKTKYVDLGSQEYYGDLTINSLRINFDSYITTPTTTEELNLYVSGSMNFYDTQDLYTTGHITYYDGIDLYTYGNGHPSSGLIPLYINTDYYPLNANKTLFIEGLAYNHSSGNTLLYTHGSPVGSGAFYSSINLYTHSISRDQYIPLYITAPNGTINTNIPLYLESHYDNTNNSLNLFTFSTSDGSYYVLTDGGSGILLDDGSILLMGGYSIGSGISSLYIRGLGTADGSYPANNNIPLFIARDSEAIDARLNLYMAQHEVVSSFDTYIQGHIPITSSTPLYIYGSGLPVTNSINFYTHGF